MAQLGGLAVLDQNNLAQLSRIPGFSNLIPQAVSGGNQVFNPQDVRNLIRSHRGDLAPLAQAAPMMGQQANVPTSPSDPFGMTAYNPNLATRTSRVGWGAGKAGIGETGFDTTGYLNAVNEYERLSKAYGESKAPGNIRAYDQESYGGMSDDEIANLRQNAQSDVGARGMRTRYVATEAARSPLAKLDPWTGVGLESFDPAKSMAWAQFAGNEKEQGRFDTFEDFYNRARAAGNVPMAELDPIKAAYDKAAGLSGAFSSKYLPETLRNQMQAHVKGGMDFAKSGLVGTNDWAVNQLTASLADRGISDLRQIGYDQGSGNYFNKTTGEPISKNVLNFKGGAGDGNMDIFLRHNDKGQVFLGSDFEKPEKGFSDYLMDYAPAIIGAMVAPGVGQALGGAIGGTAAGTALGTTGSAIAGNALGYGLTQGATSAMSGGDFGKGFLSGAIGGGLAGGIGGGPNQFNAGASMLGSSAPAWQTAAINQALAGGLTGGLSAGLSGEDVLRGILAGGAGGGVGGGLATAGGNPFAGMGAKAVAGGIKSAVGGKDFREGIRSGLASGALGLGRGALSRLGRGTV